MITEDQLEQQSLGWFRDGVWETVFGPDIVHDGTGKTAFEETALVAAC